MFVTSGSQLLPKTTEEYVSRSSLCNILFRILRTQIIFNDFNEIPKTKKQDKF